MKPATDTTRDEKLARQPQHTQGDANARYSFKSLTIGEPQETANKNQLERWKINIWNDTGKILISTLYGIDKLEVLDNAQRIVRAVNMHNELVSILDELTTRVERDCSIGSDPKLMELLNIRTKARLLLKQAEQK